jgi:hypothetical protein
MALIFWDLDGFRRPGIKQAILGFIERMLFSEERTKRLLFLPPRKHGGQGLPSGKRPKDKSLLLLFFTKEDLSQLAAAADWRRLCQRPTKSIG